MTDSVQPNNAAPAQAPAPAPVQTPAQVSVQPSVQTSVQTPAPVQTQVGGFNVENPDPITGLNQLRAQAEGNAQPLPPSPTEQAPASAPQQAQQQEQQQQQLQQPKEEQTQQEQAEPDALDNPLIGGEDKPQESAQPEGAPETYTEFFSNDNLNPEVRGVMQADLSDIARKNNWSQEQASENFKAMAQVVNRMQRMQAEEWRKETLADPEIGGKNFDSYKAYANIAFKSFLTDSERALFTQNGALNNKDVIKLLARIGRTITPETQPKGLVGANSQSNAAPATLRDFYKKYDKRN